MKSCFTYIDALGHCLWISSTFINIEVTLVNDSIPPLRTLRFSWCSFYVSYKHFELFYVRVSNSTYLDIPHTSQLHKQQWTFLG